MAEQEKKTRKRAPAKFVIQRDDASDGEWYDILSITGVKMDDLDSTQACINAIKTGALYGRIRIIQVKKTIEVKVEQKPITTITNIE